MFIFATIGITFLILCVFLLLAVLLYGYYNFFFRVIPGVPATIPKSINPFIGQMGEALETTPKFVGKLIEWSKIHGPIFQFRGLMGKPRLVITSSDALKHVFVTNCNNYRKPDLPGLRKGVIAVGRSGLVFSNGETHKKHRKLIQPIFKTSNIRSMAFVPTMIRKANVLLDLWTQQIEAHGNNVAQTVELNIKEDLARMTLEIIGKIAFGYDFNGIMKETELGSICRQLIEGSENKASDVIPFSEFIPTNENKTYWSNLKAFHNTVDGMIDQKINRMNLEGLKPDQLDILDQMLLSTDPDTGERLTPLELREEVMTFLLAGHETTSLGLSWTLLELAKHPDVQTKCRQEVIEIMDKSNSVNLTWEKLESLPYVQATIKESLRLNSPVPLVVRENINDDVIGGYKIAAGTMVFCLQQGMHRDEDVWHDSQQFLPERFIGQDVGSYSFLPFVAGPRMCIGNKFAMVEMVAVLAMMLRRFEFHPHPTIKYKPKLVITMSIDPPLKLMVKKVIEGHS